MMTSAAAFFAAMQQALNQADNGTVYGVMQDEPEKDYS